MPKHEAHCCDISVRIRSHNQNGLNNREGFPVPLNEKKWREGQSESKALFIKGRRSRDKSYLSYDCDILFTDFGKKSRYPFRDLIHRAFRLRGC